MYSTKYTKRVSRNYCLMSKIILAYLRMTLDIQCSLSLLHVRPNLFFQAFWQISLLESTRRSHYETDCIVNSVVGRVVRVSLSFRSGWDSLFSTLSWTFSSLYVFSSTLRLWLWTIMGRVISWPTLWKWGIMYVFYIRLKCNLL